MHRRRLLREINHFFPDAEVSTIGATGFDSRLKLHVENERCIDITWLGRRYRCFRERAFTTAERLLIDCLGFVLADRLADVHEPV